MRSKKISLVVVPLLLTACSSNDQVLVQDVYNSQYDCDYDWDQELCEEESSESSGSSGSHGGSGYYTTGSRFYGPSYYSENRKVNFQGRKLEPTTNLSTGQPLLARVTKSSSKSSPVRGGFGRSGFSFGG